MHLDHIVIATTDLGVSARQLADSTGLAAVKGGVHDGLGTQNYIVPLGRGYLELVAVHDSDLARDNPFGRLVLSALAGAAEAFAGWAVAVAADELGARAEQVGLPIGRLTREGVGVRHVGMTRVLESSGLPFLLTRDAGNTDPGLLAAGHSVRPRGVRRLSVGEGQSEMEAWLMTGVGVDNPELPVVCVASGRGITQVDIETDEGTVALLRNRPTTGLR
ncbi:MULTISPECIES: VOC family protein [unclassified Mycolicibacterium]|uniref:VOC family protein n=1 Tax=unclassified Mycolicibacterium TaxID=2636767 RepID=UPI002ED7EF75